jgi:hypothetical protein
MIVNGIVEPMELGHLPYKKGTYEDYVGNQGLDRVGKKRWRKLVKDVVERLVTALEPEDVVIGGGNIIHLKKLPRGCRAGNKCPCLYRRLPYVEQHVPGQLWQVTISRCRTSGLGGHFWTSTLATTRSALAAWVDNRICCSAKSITPSLIPLSAPQAVVP